MESITYLKEKLIELHNCCLFLEIKYEYKSYINTHVIDVRPIHSFNSDEKYINEQLNLEKEFELLFPYEDILFITENELVSIKDPILKLGVSESECVSETVFPPIKVEYTIDNLDSYLIGTNIMNEFTIPEPPPENPWWKYSGKHKKTLTESQGFFM